ncbi:unnamed protein product [Durusdinium trenchii]|uniref:CCHC-type domain-containing protein n=1 Tax=Durusdinium trenchii TaxID=1381693 RepID=A0ABP0JFN6_9DINO
MTKVGSLNCTSLEEKRWQRGCTCRVLPERIHHRRAAIGKPAMYWLALEAAQWTYDQDAEENPTWSLDCRNGCIYTAKATLRVREDEFSSFDVHLSGGALAQAMKIYVLAFRGTVDLNDWIKNLGAAVNWSPFADILLGVHSGWHAAVSDQSLHRKLKEALAGLDHDKILLLGHSLGGALVQIAMAFMWLEATNRESPLYNNELMKNARGILFGSPAPFVQKERGTVGQRGHNREARAWMQEHCVNFVNNNDVVPRLPFNLDFAPLGCLRSFGSAMGLTLPENVKSQLNDYEHLCSHILLKPGEVDFIQCKPCQPHALAERMESDDDGKGTGSIEDHGMPKYRGQMLEKLGEVLGDDSMPLLQFLTYQVRAGAPDINRSLCAFQDSLSHSPQDLKEKIVGSVGTILQGLHKASTRLQTLQKDLSQMKEKSLEAGHISQQSSCGNLLDSMRSLEKINTDMFTVATKVAEFVSSCVQLGMDNQSICILLGVVSAVGATATGVFCASSAAGLTLGGLVISKVVFQGVCIACMTQSGLCTLMVATKHLGHLTVPAVESAVRLALWLAKHFGHRQWPIAVLLHSIAAIVSLRGEAGFEVFKAALLKLYVDVGQWLDWLQKDLEHLKEYMGFVEKKLKDAEGNLESIEGELTVMHGKVQEILSLVQFVTGDTSSPEVIELKKKECRELFGEMRKRAEWMDKTREPVEGMDGLKLDLAAVLDIDPALGQDEKKTEGGLTKRFDGDGSNPAKDYERWRRSCRAYLTVQKAKGVGPEAHGSLVFSLLDGTALRALDQVPMDRVEEIGGEEVIFQILDDRFPAETTHDRLGSVLDQVFDLKVEKGETTAVFTGKVRAAFSSAEAEGVVLPDVARGYLLLRFAKLSAERKAVVMAAARQSYAEKDVAAALRTSSHAYQVEYDQGQVDDDEETMEEEFDVYLTDAGYQPEEEIEEQDAIDALLTWKQTRSSIAQTKMSRGFGNQGQLKKLAARVKCFKCRQVGHFSRDCPKRGKGGSKGSNKDGNNPTGGGTKVNYVFMVWNQPDTPNIRTEHHWTLDENEDGELEQNYNPPIGPEMYGHEMQALVEGWSHVPRDFWYTRGAEVIREHVLPRTRLFTPAASNCPVPLHELCDSRSTHLLKEDGSHAVHFSHNWKARGEAHKDVGVEWTGRTVFYMKDLPFTPIDEEIDMLAQAYRDELDIAQEEALKESGSEDSMMEETDEEAEYLDGETVVALVHAAGHGVVDTGCGRGLVGEKTLQRHEKVLNEHGYEIKEMLHQPHKFRYGNSAVDVSHRTVQIPVFLAGVQLWLRVHVVPGDVPLLISKRFMKCLGAIIDMRQGLATFTKAHLAVPLLEQRDGSYQINLLDFQKPPKIKDAEVEVLATDLGEEDEEEGGLNLGDAPMGTIPEDEMEEYVPTSPKPEGGDGVEETETPEEYEIETPEDHETGNTETQNQEELEVTGDQDNLTASEPEEEFCEDETGDIGVFKAGERKKIQENLTEILKAEPERPSVVEVFCPGRFAERAGDFGLKVIGSFDLSSGRDWKKASDRKKVWDLIEEEEPDLMILSPPCGPLSRLQNSTPPWKRADPEQRERDVIEARAMVAWCTRIARDRMRKGKYFIFESSATCAAWRLPAMGHLMDFDECQRVTVPACSVGLRDRESKLPFKKSWSFLTNAEAIAAMLDKLECSQDHDHQVVEGSEVLIARAVEAAKMVKIDTKGLKEIEMRALMEVMTYRYAKNEEEFKKTGMEAEPELVMELSGLAEQYHLATDDEGWSIASGASQGLRAAAKPKSRFPRSP